MYKLRNGILGCEFARKRYYADETDNTLWFRARITLGFFNQLCGTFQYVKDIGH
jgi:hypothetical protein